MNSELNYPHLSNYDEFLNYYPIGLSGVRYFSGLQTPDKDFKKGEVVKWVSCCNRFGVIVINLLHRHYPSSKCQIQRFFDKERDSTVSLSFKLPILKILSRAIQ